MRRFLFALTACLFLAGWAQAADKPNIILIFIDDQGYQDLGCFGSPNIKTPNIDGLAAGGAKFTDFYSACSVCSPSRAALMTGSYPPRVGLTKVLFPRDKVGLNPDEYTIADALKSVGYKTACVGKWHMGHLPKFLPTSNGFDSYFGIPYSNDMDRKGKNNLDENWRKKSFTTWQVPLLRDTKEIERPANQITLTDRYTEESIKFIKTHKAGPFFLYLAHTMPHIPLFVSDKFYDPDPKKAYKATIEHIDDSTGRIVAALKELGIEKDTLIVYTSDNGPWLSMKHHGGSAKPLKGGKFQTNEGGMREPCVMSWPGKIPAGTVCGEVAGTIDLLPTFAKLAGAKLPTDRVIDGNDIWPLMSGQAGAKSPHTEGYFYYKGTRLEAVRLGKWKYRVGGGKKKGKAQAGAKGTLYNLEADISETTNVIADNPEVAKKLQGAIETFDKALKANTRPIGKL